MTRAIVALSAALVLAGLSAAVFGQGGGGQAAQGAGASAQAPGIRYIVSQRILAESNEAKAELAKFQAAQQQRNTDLRAKQQGLDAIRLKAVQTSDAAERTRLQQQEQQERAVLEKATAQAQADLQSLQRQSQAALQARLKTVLDELLKGQNVQLVLNADTAVVWAAPGLDVTSAVIERLNSGGGAGTASKPAK
jgi:outer membrane protein